MKFTKQHREPRFRISKKIKLFSILSCLFGYTCLAAQNKMRCKETGFYEKPLKVCFAPCIKSVLEKQCGALLQGFKGHLEFRLVISIAKEKVLNTQLLIHDKNEPLRPKQRLSIKKALKNIPLTFVGKEDNQRLALANYHYKTSWIYSVEDGEFQNL